VTEKLLVTGDWHFGLTIGGYDFHEDIIHAVQSIIDISDDCDGLIHLGDVFHTNTPKPYVMSAVIELIDQLSVPAYFIAGNHDVGQGTLVDWSGKEKKRKPVPDALEPLRKIRFRYPVYFFNQPTYFDPYMFVPYVTDLTARYYTGMTAQELVTDAFDEALAKNVKALFCHLDVDGAQIGSERAVLRGGRLQVPDLSRPKPYLVVDGHIHKRQCFRDILFPGSVVATDFSDVDGERGYMLLEV